MTSSPATPESDTPETDAVLTAPDGAEIIVHGLTIEALAALARFLERRLAQAQARVAELEAYRDDAERAFAKHADQDRAHEARVAELEKDAERYWFIRNLLAIEDVERLVADGNPTPDEQESLRTDDAIDAALKDRA